MRKILIALGVLVVLLVIVVLAAPFFIPVDWVKQKAIEQVEAQTGRTLAIDGGVSLSLLPTVAVEVGDVRFSNIEGSDQPEMVTLSQLNLDVELFPLISGELVINEFVLEDPVIYLETDAQGNGNWVMSPADGGTGDSSGTDGSSGDTSGGSDGLASLRLGDVRIVNGTVSYSDRVTGEVTVLSDINLTLSLPDISSPFAAQGSVDYKGQTVSLDANVGSLKALMDGATSSARVAVESEPVNLSFDGEAAASGDLAGQVDLVVPSVSALAAWLQLPLEDAGQVPETIDIAGRLEKSGTKVSFTGATIAVDDLRATGDLGVDTGGARPMITATLSSEMLDLNPYLPQTESEAASGGSGEGSGGSGDGGSGQPQDWSDEPIDFSGLDIVDADLSFDVAGLKVRDMEIGRSRLEIVVQSGSATIDLLEAQLYGGGGTAHIEIDRSGNRPGIAKQLNVTGVNVEPLLIAATGYDRLSGTGDLTLDVTTTGTTERQFVSNLAGDGSFIFRDGAFKGANLAAMAREVSLDALSNAVSSDKKTDFAELSATFQINDGVVRNDDLFMAAPLLRMAGKGNVNLPPRTLDYSIALRPTDSLEGQGTGDNASGGIPILVRGSWNDPSIQPDMEAIAKGVLEDPGALADQIQNLGGSGDGEGGGLLDNLGGSGDGDGEGGGLLDNLGGENAEDALKSLFD